MPIIDIVVSQLLDPFRIGLLVFLVATARNTAHHTGVVLPLAAGAVFVAIIIPLTFAPEAENWWQLVVVGIVTNAIALAVILALFRIIARMVADPPKP